MAGANVITGTLDELVVGDGESVRLTGAVLGDVEVQAGGSLIHEGLINGLLYVEAGGHLYLHGPVERLEWEDGNDVEVHGIGRPDPGWSQLPFTGPAGWGAIDAVWGKALAQLDKAVDVAGIGTYIQERREDTSEDVFRAAAAAAAVGGVTDAQLWALLSAAVYNELETARIRGLARRGLWSPEDLRHRLPWSELERYFDSPPELFAQLLPHRDRSGRSLAFDCYEALSAVMRTMLGVGESPAEGVARIESFRTMLREQASGASRDDSPPRSKDAKPRSKRMPSTKSARTRAKPSATRGSAEPSSRGAPIRSDTDPIDAALCELDSLIGLAAVKEEVRQISGFAYIERLRARQGFPVTEVTRHLVMTGNPGTGKTTVARLLGEIYAGYGLLENATVVEVTRSNLVSNIVGDSEKRMEEAFRKALGGVLFIDEAYSLAPHDRAGWDFGQQVIDTLVPLMENHRRDIMVVAAGYPEPMRRFLSANEGLNGRFGQMIHFPNYADDELLAILGRFCEQGGFTLTPSASQAAPEVITRARERMGDTFDNARMVRRLFEKAVQRQHDRLFRLERSEDRQATPAELQEIVGEDIPTAETLVPDTASAA